MWIIGAGAWPIRVLGPVGVVLLLCPEVLDFSLLFVIFILELRLVFSWVLSC